MSHLETSWIDSGSFFTLGEKFPQAGGIVDLGSPDTRTGGDSLGTQ